VFDALSFSIDDEQFTRVALDKRLLGDALRWEIIVEMLGVHEGNGSFCKGGSVSR